MTQAVSQLHRIERERSQAGDFWRRYQAIAAGTPEEPRPAAEQPNRDFPGPVEPPVAVADPQERANPNRLEATLVADHGQPARQRLSARVALQLGPGLSVIVRD